MGRQGESEGGRERESVREKEKRSRALGDLRVGLPSWFEVKRSRVDVWGCSVEGEG